MSDLTLPGDIPGLLRRGAPVFHPSASLPGVALIAPAETVAVGVRTEGIAHVFPRVPLSSLALDLSDPTGRAHAAWWVLTWFRRDSARALSAIRDCGLTESQATTTIARAHSAAYMTSDQADTLRRIVLRVAGRIP
jgi:hypothetical protein